MKFVLTMGAVLLGGQLAFANVSSLYYQLGSVEVVPVVEMALGNAKPEMGNCQVSDPVSSSGIADDIGSIDVIIDKIINIGKKLWSLVEAGKPVYNVKTDVAHALPAGVQCWSDLENWNAPQSQSWKVTYKNKLGGKVIEFAYRVSYIYGGQYKGLGRYITQATISPSEVYVAWGYKFNVEASIPSVFNIGTHANPIAGMLMNIRWIIDTTTNHHEVEHQYYVNGIGEVQKMQTVERL